MITFTNGTPTIKEDSYFVKNEYELQKLLQALANQGKYDVALSHSEDGSQAHYDDKSRSARYEEKPRKYYRNEKYNSGRNSRVSLEQPDIDITSLNLFGNKKANLKRLSDTDNNVLEQLIGLESDKNSQGKGEEEAEYDNAEDILAFLENLQKNIIDNDNYESPLRCIGNRCGRSRNDRDDDDRDDDRANDNRYYKNDLRCKGNRCARDRDDRLDDRNDRDGLRCRGNNCARSDDRDRYDDDRDDKDTLRCVGGKCSRGDRDDDDDRDDRDRNNLRCRGNKCARSRYDDNDSDLKLETNKYAKKYKVSEDLDAVVLGMSDVDRLLSKLNVPKPRSDKLKGAKLLENVELEDLLDRSNNDKKSNVEAVVFDLTQLEDGDVLAKQIKRLLSKGEDVSEGDYEDYGNFVEDNLKLGNINLDQKAYKPRTDSKILPHSENNNNVYIPKWLLNEVLSKTNLREQTPMQLLKSLFPLTRQQKARIQQNLEKKRQAQTAAPRKIFRRNFEQDVGVPFHLEVQGLGQVKP